MLKLDKIIETPTETHNANCSPTYSIEILYDSDRPLNKNEVNVMLKFFLISKIKSLMSMNPSPTIDNFLNEMLLSVQSHQMFNIKFGESTLNPPVRTKKSPFFSFY